MCGHVRSYESCLSGRLVGWQRRASMSGHDDNCNVIFVKVMYEGKELRLETGTGSSATGTGSTATDDVSRRQ